MRVAPRKLVLMTVAAWLWPVLAMAQPPGDCGFYSYGSRSTSEGRHCGGAADAPPPQRVTAICRDQSYSYDQGSWACLDHGGVQVWRR
jgi:hypothetical protein